MRAACWFVAALLAPANLPIFRDVTTSAKVSFINAASHTRQKYLLETMGGGVAAFDYDNDSRLDLFFVNGASLPDPMPAGKLPDKSDPRYWDRLFRNNGDGTFTDVTTAAGVSGQHYGMGVAAGDYDNDGNRDLYVTGFGGNILYHNNGDGTFTNVTAKAGTGGGGWSTSAAFFDLDRDASGFQLRRIEHLIHQRFQMLARLVDIDRPFRQLILIAHSRLHLDQLAIA
jgi:hypothetical protein